MNTSLIVFKNIQTQQRGMLSVRKESVIRQKKKKQT